jgi:hypothetical protein
MPGYLGPHGILAGVAARPVPAGFSLAESRFSW